VHGPEQQQKEGAARASHFDSAAGAHARLTAVLS
jgi:hypothetical protein